MRSLHRKTVSLLMLIVFIAMSFGSYGLKSKWIAHELGHDSQAVVSFDHHHAPELGAQHTPDAEPTSDAEHKLLHALNHIEQFPSWTFVGLEEPTPRLAPALPYLLTLLPAALESPFRPPRITSLT
jgi:hypothetical protein